MADVASPYLIRTMIAKNSRRLAGRLRRRAASRFIESMRRPCGFAKIWRSMKRTLPPHGAAKRKRLPYPFDLAGGPYSARISNAGLD